MNFICTGSIAYDYLMTFPGYFRDHILPEKLDTISLSFLVDSLVRQRGGTAPNIAYNLALLGARPYIVGTVGEDFGDYRAWLESKGIDTSCVRVIPGDYTASFFANTDRSNAQIASFYPGAMAHAADFSLPELLCVKPDLVIISPNDPQAMDRFSRECQQEGYPYLYDPSQQIVRLDRDDLRRGVEGAEAVFVNEYELGLLEKHTGLHVAEITRRVKYLVVTCGAEGADVYADGQKYSIPVVPPERILDPTGVGDAFRGGFLTGVRLQVGWELCGKMGALAATYCLEQRGTQVHAYTPAEFVQRFRLYFDDGGVLDALI